MLTVRSLSYRHAGAARASLKSIDLDVADGEVVGVVGGNDAGKTTLCLVLSGLAPRVIGGTMQGDLLIDGTDMTQVPMHGMAGRVGVVFDDPAAQLSGVTTTVFEEVSFGPANLGVPRPELLERTEQALEALGIPHLAARDPARLSGGQQQLVAVASILAMRPRHIILDEPTAQLDPLGTELVGSAIAGLRREGLAVLVVEHKTDLLADVADRVIVLDGGEIRLAGVTEDILADPRLVGLGVQAPSLITLRRRLTEAGVDPSVLLSVVPT